MHKKANPKNVEFENRLKLVLGKKLEDPQFKDISFLTDEKFRESLIDKFKKIRDERISFLGKDQSKDIEKRIFLQTIDMNWKSHIQYLEQLRQVIGLRSYGQRDPLIEYKKEAFELFENLSLIHI